MRAVRVSAGEPRPPRLGLWSMCDMRQCHSGSRQLRKRGLVTRTPQDGSGTCDPPAINRPRTAIESDLVHEGAKQGENMFCGRGRELVTDRDALQRSQRRHM